MNTKITIGEFSCELTNATAADIIQLMREANSHKSKSQDVISVTREAIASSKKKTVNYLPWTTEDIGIVAKLAVALGPNAKRPASQIAKAMQKRPGNKRTYTTLYGTCYNIYRFLREGKPGNISKSTIADLEEMGYTASMMTTPAESNLLGSVRHLEVQQA